MEFRILGPLEVRDGGRRISLGGARQRTLLGILLVHANEVVSVDRLIDELWGDQPPAGAAHSLQVQVSRLRQTLRDAAADEALVTQPPGYMLRVEPHELDLAHFEYLVAEGKAQLARGEPESAAATLREALGIWRGPPLADFTYEHFAQSKIARLEDLRLVALEDRIEADVVLGRHDERVGELEALVREHPLRERLRGQLMLALYRCGRQAEALETYQEARRDLVEELGIEPGRALQALQLAILTQDSSLDLDPPPREAQSPPEPAPSPASPSPGEERKVVSILFADLVGSTAWADQADPEDVRARLRPYHARTREVIERFGGAVEKFVGDAVMAVFGAPVAHEDDAERAVRAALGIVTAVEDLSAAAPALAVRVGVDTGEVIVDLAARAEAGESIVAGNVVNAAFRLQETGPVGAVVVGERTYHATRARLEYRELEPVAVKGKAEPLRIWGAVGPLRKAAAEADRVAPAPFIGRDSDLALLEQTCARTLRESSVQLVTVVGEPGVGKTRLVREFRTTLDDERGPIVWREGRCLPYGDGITFWALGEIVKAHAAILESDTAEQAVGKLEAAVAELVDESPEREWLTSLLAPLVGVRVGGESGIEESTEMAFTAWQRFLESIAIPGSLMLVFEDLHWADPALLQFIEHLVDWSTGAPLFVVCTARPELYERAPGWGGGKRNSTTISLSPLSSDETSRLIGALLSDAVLPREVEAQLLERSGGNPLYAEEFVRMLIDRGILRRRDGAATIAPDAEIQVPETVQALIAARLDTLAPERKALVHDAAVVGKVFWSGALSSMSGVDERAVREGLHELARKELVRPSRTSSVREQAEYSFWHILIRDVAYGQIPREARARKHLAAAAWSEGISEGRVSDHAELLAYHYGQALDLTRAAGASDDAKQLEEPTRRFLVMAGDRVLRLDVRVAAAYYRQALDLLPVGQERASVLAKAAEAAWLSGLFEEAEPRYRDAIAGFQDQKNIMRAGETMVRLSMALRDRGDTRQAQSLLSDAVALLEREPAGPERVLAYTHVARDHMFSGCYRASLEWAEKAIAVAEELGIEGHAMRALQSRGWCRCELGDLGGVDDLREALRIGLEFGLADETAVAYINLGNWLWQGEGPTSALEILREGIDFDSRRGLTFRAMWTRAESTWPLFDLGEWDELLRITDEVAGWERQHGGVQVGLRALPYKAAVLVHRGRLDEASSLQERFLPPARAIGDPDVLMPALAVSALIAQAAERPAAAVEFIEELEMGTRDRFFDRHLHVTDAMRISAAAGRLDLGQRFLEDAAFAARPRCSLLAARAGAVEGHGELELAAELYAEAASRWEEYGHVLERGYALLGGGRCLARVGRWAEASARLEEARAVFAALYAGALVAEAERWLAKAEV